MEIQEAEDTRRLSIPRGLPSPPRRGFWTQPIWATGSCCDSTVLALPRVIGGASSPPNATISCHNGPVREAVLHKT